LILSGNQALDPAGIASYCCYREQEKGYARSRKVLGCFVVHQASYQHNLQLTKGLIAHNPLTGQRVWCTEKPNGWRAKTSHL